MSDKILYSACLELKTKWWFWLWDLKKKKSPKFNNALRCQSHLVSVIQSINITRCSGTKESKTFVAIPKIKSSPHRCAVSVRALSTKLKPHVPIGHSSLTIHGGIPWRFCSCCEVMLAFCQDLMRTELLWVMISPEQPGSYLNNSSAATVSTGTFWYSNIPWSLIWHKLTQTLLWPRCMIVK